MAMYWTEQDQPRPLTNREKSHGQLSWIVMLDGKWAAAFESGVDAYAWAHQCIDSGYIDVVIFDVLTATSVGWDSREWSWGAE